MSFAAIRLTLIAALLASGTVQTASATATAETALPSAAVRAGDAEGASAFDGVVQAQRQTAITAQVAGAIVALQVKAGDTVRAGQVLLRLDARAADQVAAAGAAQVEAARAAEEEARKELARQRQLFEKQYISRSALERAEARFETARAQAAAQRAAAGASRTQSGFYLVTAPYDAVVSDVPVTLGDMAMPGRPLLTLYDPRALRVSVNVPQTAAARMPQGATPRLTLGGDTGEVTPVRVQWLPVADPSTHTVELRLDLPRELRGIVPGAFARVWLPTTSKEQRLYVPASAVVRRAELSAVYVLGGDGRPMLRQVRLGRASGDSVEVLSGLAQGERVVLDPAAAARLR